MCLLILLCLHLFHLFTPLLSWPAHSLWCTSDGLSISGLTRNLTDLNSKVNVCLSLSPYFRGDVGHCVTLPIHFEKFLTFVQNQNDDILSNYFHSEQIFPQLSQLNVISSPTTQIQSQTKAENMDLSPQTPPLPLSCKHQWYAYMSQTPIYYTRLPKEVSKKRKPTDSDKWIPDPHLNIALPSVREWKRRKTHECTQNTHLFIDSDTQNDRSYQCQTQFTNDQMKSHNDILSCQSLSLLSSFPAHPGPLAHLISDIRIPHFISHFSLSQVNLWISARQTYSNLHFDDYSNLLCVVSGRKIVLLFPPSTTTPLLPHPLHHISPNHSEIDTQYLVGLVENDGFCEKIGGKIVLLNER
jgi:hypothetical protein